MDGDAEESVPLVTMSKNYARNASVVGDPQASALEAVKNGDHQLLCDLLTEDGGKVVDINHNYEDENYKTLLHVAVDQEDVESVRLILGARAKVNEVNRVLKVTPLLVAARKGNAEIMQLLLKNNADVNASYDGKTALHILTKKCKSLEDAKYLTCLMIAVRVPGIQLDKKEKSADMTPLKIAISETANFEAVKVLAGAGADVSDVRDDILQVFGQKSL